VDTTVEQRVLAQLNEREIIELAGELIWIPSFCPDETPVARFLAAHFEQRGYDVDLQEVEPGRFQTIATLRGAGGGRSLMFNGHLDINSLMLGGTREPWTPSVEGNRAFLPAHRAGREREYCHIEKLANLDQLPHPHGFQVSVFPIKIARASGGWVRAVALVDD
jgi:hypothetical protein